MPPSKKILGVVGYTFLPSRTGGHRGIRDMYDALGLIHEVYILSTIENETDGKKYRFSLIDNLGSNSSKWRYINPSLFFKIKKIIKQYQIDVVQIDHPYLGWLGLWIEWFTPAKFYVRSHNIEYFRFKELKKIWWPIMKWYERFVYWIADQVMFITEEDMAFAKKKWNIKKSQLLTFGTWTSQSRSEETYQQNKTKILNKLGLDADCKLINFNGPMDYYANKDALKTILTLIAPQIYKYRPDIRIVLCGSAFPEEYKEDLAKAPNVIWEGFVDDLDIYLTGADQFWNPIRLGGGIKTKLIQALAEGLTVISYESGAIGIIPESCADKLILIKDGFWDQFVHESILNIDNLSATPPSFYATYYWPNIVQNVHY